jgi:hypothetical protein
MGDICCKQLELKNQEINFLNSVISNNEQIIFHLDSIIKNQMLKNEINQNKFAQAEQQIKYERKRARKFKRQRNGIAVGGGLIVLLFVFAVANP